MGTGYLLIIGILKKSVVRIIFGLPAIILPFMWLFLASFSPIPEEAFEDAFLLKVPKGINVIQTYKRTFMDGHFITFTSSSIDVFTGIVSKHFRHDEISSLPKYLKGHKPPKWWPKHFPENSLVYLRNWNSRGVNELRVFVIYLPNTQKAYCIVKYPPLY